MSAGHVEARGAGPEATFLGRVQLLQAAAALRGDERARAVLLLWPEQAGLRAGLSVPSPAAAAVPPTEPPVLSAWTKLLNFNL